jgi:hypothetical protein
LKTKFMLGAIVVAVLAVLGVVGFQQTDDTEAGTLAVLGGGWNPTTITPGNQSSIQLTFLDDNGSTINLALGGGTGTGVITSVTIPGCAATITGVGTANVIIYDAGGPSPANGTGCDADANATQYVATITVTCTTAGTLPLAITNPAIAGGGSGSMLPGFTNPPPGTNVLQCLATNLAGNNPNTITLTKIDQFGQPLAAVFSIQQSPFWVEVAKVSVGPAPQQNPCNTAGINPLTGAACAAGQVTPAPFTTGLPNGTYRVVEIAATNQNCTLVQIYNGNLGPSGQTFTQPNAGTFLTQPVSITLPNANPLDLQLTFVNSCHLPGGPSTATSQIAVVIGGSTPGLVNTSNVEIVPAPGSDDDARLDIRIRDVASIPIPNAHVTVLIDKGALALRRDLSGFPNSGYDVIEPTPPNFASPFSADTCDQSTNGFWQQSTTTGSYTWPFLTASRQQADGYTNVDGIISACVYVDTTLAPGTTPGKINIQAIVESPGQGGLYNPGLGVNPYYPLGNNLSLPNYFGVPNIVLTASITVVGPPASITVAAAPTSLNCGEKATITVTVKDSAGQNVSDRTRVELVTNFGGVIGGTTATLGPVGITGGNVYPVSSSSAETFNGVATAYLLTSTDHVGPYEVVAAAGGSVMASNGYLAPWYAPGVSSAANLTPNISAYFPWYANQGLLSYSPSSAPVNAQATVTCTVPGAPAAAAPAPVVTAPRTGQGPADAFAIRPPNTGDAGLATSSSSSLALFAGLMVVLTVSGVAVATVTRR